MAAVDTPVVVNNAVVEIRLVTMAIKHGCKYVSFPTTPSCVVSTTNTKQVIMLPKSMLLFY
ncbi:hypothetical protein DPMN_115554 [Dreissena polymorpha]|uniref:Uncharacterized protein n=1 Tax=Dreissena polymorpha TaxID=45954 RepID=A0A9D4KN16_DREPO|nr:hypothetical protein DPMN_115554 [Dreissena polymorpha]